MNISLMWPHLMLVAGIFPKFSSVFAQLGHADEAQYLGEFVIVRLCIIRVKEVLTYYRTSFLKQQTLTLCKPLPTLLRMKISP